jgi:hypothetical protein
MCIGGSRSKGLSRTWIVLTGLIIINYVFPGGSVQEKDCAEEMLQRCWSLTDGGPEDFWE